MRGQASLEFIVSYGWAMLLIIIVAATLVYLNFDGTESVTDSCSFGPSFHCTELKIVDKESEDLFLFLTNDLGKDVLLNGSSFSVSYDGGVLPSTACVREPGAVALSGSFSFGMGETLELRCELSDHMSYSVGEVLVLRAQFSYRPIPGSFVHLASGDIIAAVE